MIEDKPIIEERQGAIKIIRLNRPEKYNALNMSLRRDLLRAIQETSTDDTRVLIITGEGKSFCTGGDINDWKGAEAADHMKRLGLLNKIVYNLANLPQPVITAVNGYAYGAGCNLALAGDIVIGAENARFSQNFTNIGLIPDGGGTYILPRVVGTRKALELVLTGVEVSAAEAYQLGMINKVVPLKDLEKTAISFADNLAKKSFHSLNFAKKLIRKSYQMDLSTALDEECLAQNFCMHTEENKKAIETFLTKENKTREGKKLK